MGYLTRDFPKSFGDFFVGWIPNAKKELTIRKSDRELLESEEEYAERMEQAAAIGKFKKYLPIITTGSGLFSDGYVNNSIGTVSTCLSLLYPDEYANSNAIRNVSSIAFAGTVVGMLAFGYISDYHSRRSSMLWGTTLLIVMTVLTSGVWGKNKNDISGMLTALTVYRFFLGIGIGSEYPAGATACAEASMLLPPGKRNRWFTWFTHFMIDAGFAVSAFVPLVLLWIFKEDHLTPVWRLTLGLGAIPPLSLFVLRLFYEEGDQYKKTRFKHVAVPYWAIIKFYWFRLLVVSLIWFIYDYSAYAFGLFSSYVLINVMDDSNLFEVFGWNVVLNLFYIPGAFLGAYACDFFGPRLTMVIGIFAQSIIGYAMAASFETLKNQTAGFVILYGIFMTLGEFGPGDSIGILASKTCSTPIRGQYYGVAAAIGKVGAFIGTYCFTPMVEQHGIKSAWYLAASFGIFAGLLALFCLPAVDQSAMQAEDANFMEYLESIGFDTSLLGEDVMELDPEGVSVSSGTSSGKGEKVKTTVVEA